jgi:two-component system sensor histidine kinase KdpD
MTADAERPDPDALLLRLRQQESRARQGKLRIFFGFAPGVGKTYRMLQVARDRVIEHGEDVLVGVVETHKRMETASLLLGLEILPRRKIEHRGRTLEEFDLDAALARKPKVLLLDELAHTNAPGARHPKRWQDALELLEAGIDVFTTVNVQHVESLNDVVAQITHVRVRETVPDAILDRADEIELVDVTPEELLLRMKEGKVYLPDQALRAAEHFFQRGNLLALRELALRRTAQRVDADVQEYRQEHGVVTTWPAGERILVCVGPSPTSERLIRAAFRTAAGLRAPWVAAFVEPTVPTRDGEADRGRLEAHLRLAESLGAAVTRLSGPSVSQAVLGYARKHNVTRIVVGKPTHSRLRDRVVGSLLDEVVRGSGDIDVHVISGDPVSQPTREPRPRAPAGESGAPAVRYLWASLLVMLTTLLGWGARSVLQIPDVEMLYLLAVMVSAVALGRGPSVLAAGLGVACYDFFFVPPYLTFAVSDSKYVLTFAMLFAVGLLISELTTRFRRQQRAAIVREERTAGLYALSRDLGAAEDPKAAGAVLARHVAETFEGAAHVLRAEASGSLFVLTAFPPDARLDPKELAVARWAFEHGRFAGLGTDSLPGSKTVCAPLQLAGSTLGVLAIERASGAALTVEQREHLEAFCRQAAFVFERSRLEDDARATALRLKTEEMRASLLGAVSHDLRTPLAAITGAASALRDQPALAGATRGELLETICEEAERLERLVGNLLDMTRLEAGAAILGREWVPLDELVGSALTRLEKKLGERPIRVELPSTLPLLSVDPVLLEQLFVNLLENAAKYTPAGSPLEIEASVEDGQAVIEVRDHGPGLLPGGEEAVFQKFYRGAHAGVPGVGLGLPICRAIAEAHGGSIRARNRAEGGAVFRVTLPLRGPPPAVPELPPAEATS